MNQPHQIDIDGFAEGFEPSTMLAACATKRLWAKISFGTNPDEHPATVGFCISVGGEDVFSSFLLREAVAKYNELP